MSSGRLAGEYSLDRVMNQISCLRSLVDGVSRDIGDRDIRGRLEELFRQVHNQEEQLRSLDGQDESEKSAAMMEFCRVRMECLNYLSTLPECSLSQTR